MAVTCWNSVPEQPPSPFKNTWKREPPVCVHMRGLGGTGGEGVPVLTCWSCFTRAATLTVQEYMGG